MEVQRHTHRELWPSSCDVPTSVLSGPGNDNKRGVAGLWCFGQSEFGAEAVSVAANSFILQPTL